jgi:septum formation topological specificity factor MinE
MQMNVIKIMVDVLKYVSTQSDRMNVAVTTDTSSTQTVFNVTLKNATKNML